jgi:hypothetical protein
MKSYEAFRDKRLWGKSDERTALDCEIAYNAGAANMRESLRCETCLGHVNGVCEKDVFMYGRITPNSFGCASHKERKGEVK